MKACFKQRVKMNEQVSIGSPSLKVQALLCGVVLLCVVVITRFHNSTWQGLSSWTKIALKSSHVPEWIVWLKDLPTWYLHLSKKSLHWQISLKNVFKVILVKLLKINISVVGNWVDINYIIPTGPQTCDVLFDWYLDTDVYNRMSKREREEAVAENIKER